MNLLLIPALAHALTLDDAVRRAAEVDPDAVVAALEWKRSRLDAAEAWTGLGLTPSLSASRRFAGGTVADANSVSVSVGVLDAPAWFNATQQSTQARGAGRAAGATLLDAQYAAATLFYATLSAEAGLEASREGEQFAKATSEATAARVSAGLESELAGRSAQLGLLEAQAKTAQAEADLSIARAGLGRALEQPIDTLEAPASLPELPGGDGRSPWIDVAESTLAAERLAHYEALAGLLPVGSLTADSSLSSLNEWALTVGLTWSFDGLAGPFLRARNAALSQKIAEVELDALERDVDLALYSAREVARAAERVADAARARQALADESLQVGQTRLSVGLASSLEVLRLQDEAAKARADRVDAELTEAQARLEARRLAGVVW